MKPKISVLMAVYNGGEKLRYSIESILNQTLKDFEFLIVNDGSTDDSLHIIKEYAKDDKRIKIINKSHSGLTKSLNKGIYCAKGYYIARMDSGDVSHQDRLLKQYGFMQSNDNISACFTWTKIIDASSSKIGELVFSTKPLRIQNNLMKGRNIYTHGSAMFRKEAILNIGGYDEAMKTSQDFELWLRMIRKGFKLGAVNEFLYQWRLIQDSISIHESEKQKIYHDRVLNMHNANPLAKFVDNKEVTRNEKKQSLLHSYQNLYFRNQSRQSLYQNTIKLMKARELTKKEMLKFLISLSPISYKWIFKWL